MRQSSRIFKLKLCSSIHSRIAWGDAAIARASISLPIKIQNKENTMFLAVLQLSFALELTQK